MTRTTAELKDMSESELIAEIQKLNGMLAKYRPDQYRAALVHNYHFESDHLLKLNRERMSASGVILAVYDLSGAVRVSPILIKDGFSNATINALLDDMQYSYDSATEFKPVTKRL